MQTLAATVEALLWESESASLNFKETQYSFVGAEDSAKSEILKDILAFANTFRRADAFILLGVREVCGGRAEVIGVRNHLAEASLQEFVNSKTNRTVQFSYHGVALNGKDVGVIKVPGQQKRPLFATKNYGHVEALAVYLRRGSSTAKANPDEIAQMGSERPQSAEPDPERKALELLLQHARFAESVWQLINDISQLPDHFITQIARPPAYDAAKRARWSTFNLEYVIFKRDLATAINLLGKLGDRDGREGIDRVLAAAQELRDSVGSFVSTAHETYALHHTTSRENAFAAADRVSHVVAERVVALSRRT